LGCRQRRWSRSRAASPWTRSKLADRRRRTADAVPRWLHDPRDPLVHPDVQVSAPLPRRSGRDLGPGDRSDGACWLARPRRDRACGVAHPDRSGRHEAEQGPSPCPPAACLSGPSAGRCRAPVEGHPARRAQATRLTCSSLL
ncbi:hypothetical protein LTR94_033115, partial [Friedmanniomyces endolithicus]